MQTALVFATLLLAPCVGILASTNTSHVRQTGGVPSGVPDASSMHLRMKINLLAESLGRFLDLVGVPLAFRLAAAHVVVTQEVNFLEQLHGHSFGTKIFRDCIHHLLPVWPLFLSSISLVPGSLPANVTEDTQIVKDGQKLLSISTNTCVDGICTHNNSTADDSGAGILDPKVPRQTIQHILMDDLSNVVGTVVDELQNAKPNDITEVIDSWVDGLAPSDGQAENSAGSGKFLNSTMKDLHDILGDMFGSILPDIARNGSAPVQGTRDQENDDKTSIVTTIKNGHALQEATTCKVGKCTTERHKFDALADIVGGLMLPNS